MKGLMVARTLKRSSNVILHPTSSE